MDTSVGGVMCGSNSSVSMKTSDGVSDQFPAGLRVLVVDDDPTCLKILEKMLRNCLYEVITCTRAVVALSMLRERKLLFDLVISDVHMPDMDGFKLLEHIGLEMDLPVIMMSVDDKKEVVMKGVTHGACDYLIKPVRIEAIKNIWQHVVRKRRNELRELEQSGSVEDNDRNRKTCDDLDYSSSANEGSWKNSKKRKEEEDEAEDRDDSSTLKKPRVVWSVELHQQFVAAVNQLGIEKAVPKKILELMNVPGLTRENVASHLQKYRLYLRRLSNVSQHQGGHTPFLCSQEANFGSMSSFDGLDLHALAVSSQLPPNSFATLQAGGLTRSAVNTGMGTPPMDQRNTFNLEASKVRFGASQPQNDNDKQVNLYHGLSTVIEPKQLPQLQQPVQSSSSMGLQVNGGATGFMSLPASLGAHTMAHNGTAHGNQMVQVAQNRSRGQFLNELSGGHPSGIPLSLGQQMFSNELTGRVSGRNMPISNGRAAIYTLGSQASPVLDFQMNHNLELPAAGFPQGITAGVSSIQQTRMFQDRETLEVKGTRGFPTNYGIFNEQPQNKMQDWEIRNVNSNFEASSPVLASGRKSALNGNASISSSTIVSLGEENQVGTSESSVQLGNRPPLDSAFRVKCETFGDFNCDNTFIGKPFDQDDLMSAILKQFKSLSKTMSSVLMFPVMDDSMQFLFHPERSVKAHAPSGTRAA
ncbi:hypothetical protein IFM89_005627 [Coptis chinensis]|uniref:Two-component response regulator n=1 Tax=Coptis chinensis TaxID=261450 RepID=A0A835LYN6_9MAGN|nr:hypothetical protein IFM89_005627 [Coptis chinensis]